MEPASLLAGGLIALLFAIPFLNDDDDGSDAPAGPTLDPVNGTVTGTEGADDIDMIALNAEETDPDIDYVTAYGREGDDTISALDGSSAYGDDGDDIIDFAGGEGETTIDGGAGDDVLTGAASYSDILGGAGNDTVNISWDTSSDGDDPFVDLGDGDDLLIFDGPAGTGYGVIDGAGDDTIRILNASANPMIGDGSPGFTAGAGNDVYEFTLRPDGNAVIPQDDPEFTGYAHAGVIYTTNDDFETGADRIVVDPYSLAGDATYTGVRSLLASGTGYQEILFTYTHPDYPQGLAISMAIEGSKHIPLEYIQIVGAPATAAA